MNVAALSLGQFHEVSVSTESLADSLQFYELMGFVTNRVEPIWPHPYAVVSLGKLVVGLHEYRFPSPSITCVHHEIDAALQAYQEAGAVIAFAKTDPNHFREFGFRDPAGHMVTLLEKPTHLGDAIDPNGVSRTLGRFAGFSLPSAASEISSGFWQAIGARPLVGQPMDSRAWPVTMLDAAGLIMGIHDDSWLDKPAFVFHRPGASEKTVFESPEGARLIVIG